MLTPHPHASLIHRGIGRVEVFDFAPNALKKLRRTLRELACEGYSRLSLHAPMPRCDHFPYSGVTVFFLNEDARKREASLHVTEETLALAREWKAEYVVSHLTFGPADTKDPACAQSLGARACAKLARLCRVYEMPIHIEFAPYTSSLHQPRKFMSLIQEHPELGICIDVGHAFIGSELHHRSYKEDLEILSTRVRSVHLWNTKGIDHNRAHGHTPLHPGQTPRDGWIDIESSLEIILGGNPQASIIFEYPVREVSPEIREGYDWIEAIVRNFKSKMQTGGAAHETVQNPAHQL